MEQGVIKFGKNLVSTKECLAPGHSFCPGCAEALTIRLVGKALGENFIMAMATGCDEVCTTPLPYTSWRIPWLHTIFENAAAEISGVEAGLKIMIKKGKMPDKKIKCVAMGGDGATSDIGLQALSGAFERGHEFLYICLDNEAYMNTGIQRSSATPFGASTTTQPAGKVSSGQPTWKKNVPAIAIAHDIPYVATACPSYPFDLMNKVKKAASIEGPSYIHVLSVCPTGWRIPSNMTITLGKLAVETAVFPLYEVESEKYTLNVKPQKLRPVEEYLKPQGRFRHLTPELIEKIQHRVNVEYGRLLAKVSTE
ncbi:MAG: pyruvate ferredoxin oxidoreductase [Dehalococcoidia bacterium]|nr:pyruvate ferredoxin oxidoreductase [Dehalococcoidia bacterium]